MENASELSRFNHQHAPHLEWEIEEYTNYERGKRWYLYASLAAGLLLVLALWYQNFLAAVIILLTAIVIFVRIYTSPPKLGVAIYKDGVAIGERFFPYKELKTFWIIYEPPQVKTLYFDFQSNWQPRLPIPLKDTNPVEVRRILLDYLEEDLEREGEPSSDMFSRIFRI